MSEIGEVASLLSFLAANQGVSLRDASRATGLGKRELVRRLDAISLCGVPPYSPTDYISYRLVGAGADAVIQLQCAQHFARPLNFTMQETLALRYALEHFAQAADDESAATVAELVEALGNALQGRAREAMAENPRAFAIPRRTQAIRALMATLFDAVDGRWISDLEYYSSHRARLGRRRVHPYQVVEIGAHFYLYAYCEMAGATRHFRLDRICGANMTDTRYERRPPSRRTAGKMTAMFEGEPRDQMAVRFSPAVARDVADDWKASPGAEIVPRKDGSIELRIPLFNQFWAVGFVTSFGADAKLLRPAWLKQEVAQTIRRTLAAHGP